MCGRFQIQASWAELYAMYRVWAPLEPPTVTLPQLNTAPTQTVPVVVHREGPYAAGMRWGFPAMWLASKGQDPWSRSLINARSEEAATKYLWRASLAKRRCLVPTTGFYEWQKHGKKKYPLWFTPREGTVLTVAGIWGSFARGEAQQPCVAVLTTAASGAVAPVHHRMPVVLPPEAWEAWLDPATSSQEVQALCRPAPEDALEVQEVSTSLNSWRSTGPELLEADWSREALGDAASR